ncbi:TPA: type II toxin-antitoxin system VapC family toxin [Candidatus Bathyarchaeota archaeon]|nr:type II toxin-antitoxin system VapC family toxin [Candidatus Bathyarchaeota archaeon]
MLKGKLREADEVYAPAAVLAELTRKYRKEGANARILEARLSRIFKISRIISVDKNVAMKAAEIDFELRKKAKESKLKEPSLLDAMVLAATKILGATLITGDERLKGRPEVFWIGGV